MSVALATRQSIRRRLLAPLVSALLLMVVVTAAITFWVASSLANDAYDRSLLDPALDLQQNIRVDSGTLRLDLPAKAQEALMYDQTDEVVFQIRAPNGTVIAGVDELPSTTGLERGRHIFYNATLNGKPFRVAALMSEQKALIQVGETLQKRNRLVREILLAEFVPTLLFALVTIAIACVAVAHGLAPLARVRAELLGRSPRDLRSVPLDLAPIEIDPVVDAVNQLLSRLRGADAVQKRFLANAAHQLRTPLAGLQMHLELLLRGERTNEERKELEQVYRATLRTTHMLHQLLVLARAESAPVLEPILQVVNLCDCAEAAAQQWVPIAIARRIDLGFELDPVTVTGDTSLLAELLGNLIDNALRYTEEGGAVTVKCGMWRGVPYLSVEDNGPGIAPSERDNVFERFHRIPGTPGDGSGLGLAIVKEIADRHHARVAIQTSSNGRGARIVVLFDPATRSRRNAFGAVMANA